jgi:protein arginine N-methyltransferase 1
MTSGRAPASCPAGCRFGARRVYAIEPDDAIQVAREIAVANGCADRIEFIQAVSTEVTWSERADVIISDIGAPWFQKHIRRSPTRVVSCAWRRVDPAARRVAWAAVLENRYLYGRQIRPWDDNGFGLDMEAARRIVVNT